SIADQFIRNPGNERQTGNADGELRPECLNREERVNRDGDEHHRDQKAGPAAGMKGTVGLCFRDRNRLARFKGENRLVLGAVVLVNPMNILEERDSPDEEQEECDTDCSVNEIKEHLIFKGWELMLQTSRCQQRQKLVKEDEECERDDDVDSGHPTADLDL